MMRDALRLLVAIAQGALIFTTASFLLTLISFKVLLPPGAPLAPPPRVPSPAEVITLALMILAPAALGGWWVFRKLRIHYGRREARAAGITFGVFSPVPLIVGLTLGEIIGGSTEDLFGTSFALPGAFVGIVLIIAVLSFLPSALALRIAHRSRSTEQESR